MSPIAPEIGTVLPYHPTMFHTATVRPTRSGPNILYNTPLRPLHTAGKLCPVMFRTATVKPTRSGPSILCNTPLRYTAHKRSTSCRFLSL